MSDVTVTSSRPPHLGTQSVESIHKFSVQEEEDVFDLPGLPPPLHKIHSGAGEDMAPSLGALRTRLNPPRSGLPSYSGNLASGDSASGKSGSKEWTPDFQPLSSVFSEIARLRGESIEEEPPVQKHSEVRPPRSNFLERSSGPPPLLTSMPPKTDKLTAPIPLPKQFSNPEAHLPLRGFYPRPMSHYHHSQDAFPPVRSNPQLAPPAYSLVMSSRSSSGGSVKSRSSQHSQNRAPLPFSLPPSISAAPSLSHTSHSHDSSLTSPAMSPSLSPSLTPLTTHSSLQSANHKTFLNGNSSSDLRSVIRSHSRKNKPKERMVHV